MIVYECAQRSPEWHALRCGKATASRADDLLAKTKTGWGAGRAHYRTQLVLERLTGKPQEHVRQTQAMLDGIEKEADAQALYELTTGRLLRQVGFVAHDTIAAGCSPDGVLGDFVGLVEVKCPLASTHLEYLERGDVPDDYHKQVIHSLWVTGAAWCDWVSYHPDFPEPLRLKVVRVPRIEPVIAEYQRQVEVFLAEVETKLQALQTLLDLSGQLRAAVTA